MLRLRGTTVADSRTVTGSSRSGRLVAKTVAHAWAGIRSERISCCVSAC